MLAYEDCQCACDFCVEDFCKCVFNGDIDFYWYMCYLQASFNAFEEFIKTKVSAFIYFPPKYGTLACAISCLS